LALPYVELDAFMHQPGWQPRPDDEFMDEIERATTGPAWVVDGNYRRFVIEGPVWNRADTVVWLDLPRRTAMRQVVVRTIRRAVTREVLWNGNREPLTNFTSLDPYKNIIVWTWVNHDKYTERYAHAMTDPVWAHLRFVRLPSHSAAGRWLNTIGAPE
jgi:adenylate kinase family enzyme